MSMSRRRATAAGLVDGGFFIMTIPLRSYDELVALGQGLRAATAAPELLAQAVAHDRHLLLERLSRFAASAEVREAVMLATATLEADLEQLGLRSGIERALIRYVARMTTTTTPFGLFAGYGHGAVAKTTQLGKGARTHRRVTRLDGDYLAALAEELARDPAIRRRAKLTPNSSLYVLGDRIRYAACVHRAERSYELCAVELTEPLRVTLERAEMGATLEELARALVEALADVTLEEAREFVDELVEVQVLVTDFAPPLTVEDPVADLILQLERLGVTTGPRPALVQVRESLARIDAEGVGHERYRYRDALAQLPDVSGSSPRVWTDTLIDLDDATLGHDVVRAAIRGCELLQRIGGAVSPLGLGRLREVFVSRWGTRELPLLEALDEDSELSFSGARMAAVDPSPVLAGLPFNREAPAEWARWRRREQHLSRLVHDAVRAREIEISLAETDVEMLGNLPPPAMLDACSVAVVLAARTDAAVAAGDYELHVRAVRGSTIAPHIARYCQYDPRLADKVRAYLETEARHHPEAIYAEIVHLPEGHAANLVVRPVLREWDIVLLGKSGVAADRQLPASDLLVSVRNGRFVLRSRRLEREIIPRLTASHAYSARSIGVYKFLHMLQAQDTTVPAWTWGALEALPSLPRIRCERIILSLARWQLSRSQIDGLAAVTASDAYAMLRELRRDRDIPRWVTYVDGERRMPVDLDNILMVESLVHAIRGRDSAVLEEMWPDPERLLVRNDAGRFRHELIVPLVRPAPPAHHAGPVRQRSEPVERHTPGGRWLQLRIHGGPATGDDILRRLVRQIVEGLSPDAVWFFERNPDPAPHVAVIVGDEPDSITEVLRAAHRLAEPLVQGGSISHIDVPTFEREVARFGEQAAALVEQLLRQDSEAALAIVELFAGAPELDARWRLAVRGVDALFTVLGIELASRIELLADAGAITARTLGADAALLRAAGGRFRAERAALEALLDPARDSQSELASALAVFADASHAMRASAAKLRQICGGGPHSLLTSIATFCARKHVARMVRSSPREHELVVFDYLARIYRSRRARNRT